MRIPRLVAVAAAGASLAIGLAGCGGDEGELTIYSGRQRELVGPLLDRFAEETGVDVAVRYGDSSELALLIDEEGDRSPADVFVSQSPGALGFLAGGDRLEPLGPGVLSAVDSRFASTEGRWVGLSGRVRTLVYNTDAVEEDDLPDSVFDLTRSDYEGRVGLAPENGSFQDFVTAMRLSVGDDRAGAWLRGMADNGAVTYGDNAAIVQAVARGEVDFGLVNHYYNERQLAEDADSPTANHFFADGDLGALLLVTGAAVLDTNDVGGDAERLVRFLLEADAQRYFAEETFEYPLAAGVDPVAGVPPLDTIEVADVRLDDLGGGLARTRELIAERGFSPA